MPLTIALAAVALVKNIQEGCELYKQAKESFVEVKETYDEVAGIAQEVGGFVGPIVVWLRRFFASAPDKPASKPAAAARKSKVVTLDETKVMADVVKNLGEFFKLQEQLAAKIRAAEHQNQNVYDPDQNLMQAAMERVMALDQMAALEVTIRETMVYQSPPEMGALYSKVFEMRDIVAAEQEQARLAQEARERRRAWQRRQQEARQQMRIAVALAMLFLLGYLHLLFQLLKMSKTTGST